MGGAGADRPFFAFALVGVPLVLGTIAIVVLAGEKLLPSRSPRTIPPDFSAHARTLVEQYELEHREDTLFTRGKGIAEVVIPPRSEAVGETVFPGMVTSSGEFVVLAVQRKGEELGPEDAVLAVGDTLLLRGTWDALEDKLDDRSVLVVDTPDLVRRQVVPLGAGAKRALAALAGMVVLLATGAVPAAVAGLLAACAIVLLGVLSAEQAYRGISWTTVILIGGMISLSTAMVKTGAAETLADDLVSIVGNAGPHALLLGLPLLALFGVVAVLLVPLFWGF